MCTVQPRGTTMPVISSDTPNPSRQVRMVSGRVAAEEQVERAVKNRRPVLLKYCPGFTPQKAHSGRIMTAASASRHPP